MLVKVYSGDIYTRILKENELHNSHCKWADIHLTQEDNV